MYLNFSKSIIRTRSLLSIVNYLYKCSDDIASYAVLFRYCGIHYGQGPEVLLYGDEHKITSRTPCNWDGNRHGSSGVANKGKTVVKTRFEYNVVYYNWMIKCRWHVSSTWSS